MKNIKLLLLISAIVLPSYCFALPAFPMAFWGSVTLNGVSAPVGTVIKAYYGDTLAGQVTVSETGIYGYTEVTKQKLLLAEGNGAIVFKVQQSSFNSGVETSGDTPQIYNSFIAGETINQNFSFEKTVTAPSHTNSGGGGGSSSSTQKKEEVVAPGDSPVGSGDMNADGKVNKYDFALLMSDWGKTGSSTSDLNEDGKVDKYDFSLLMSKWTN